jgi:hypothetical protein
MATPDTPPTVASTPCSDTHTYACTPDYRRGYVRGYQAAIDACERLLRDPHLTAAWAMKAADDYLVYQLDEWRHDLAHAMLPPPFTAGTAYAGAAPATTAAEREYTRPEFRRGYVHGWDAAIDALAALLLGCHTPREDALTVAREHVERQLEPWRDATTAAHTHAPPVLPPHHPATPHAP